MTFPNNPEPLHVDTVLEEFKDKTRKEIREEVCREFNNRNERARYRHDFLLQVFSGLAWLVGGLAVIALIGFGIVRFNNYSVESGKPTEQCCVVLDDDGECALASCLQRTAESGGQVACCSLLKGFHQDRCVDVVGD